MATEPNELREYQYVVNNQITTAMLTPKMAERLGATAVGAEPADKNGGYSNQQNQAVYATTDMSGGVTGDGATEPVRVQQRGLDDEGRTASMRPPKSADDAPDNTDAATKARKARDK